ncbi:MAG: MOSC N-terminal beta barrel domain-containing protein [Litoreibacter sp.]
MTITVAHLYRHPIKAHGRESLDWVTLTEGQTMPWDRAWAVAHEGARTDGSAWASCANFSRGAKAPSLMAVTSHLDEDSEEITLRHPGKQDITIHPERDSDRLVEWVKSLMPTERAQSTRVVRVPNRGMTDTEFPSISINSIATHAAVADQLGQPLSIDRWRGNIWLDGMEAWQEFDWVGKSVQIGEAVFDIRQQITRCRATMVNPDTGVLGADTLAALKSFGHQEFGIYGVVTKSGAVALGDAVVII